MVPFHVRAQRAAWLALALVLAACSLARAQAGPLPSWTEGAARQALLAFVAAVTAEDGPDFVPMEERIAVFDNDGTLWAEQPLYVQLAFTLDRVKALAPAHPEWRGTQPFQALLEGRPDALLAAGGEGLTAVLAATHAGMTTEVFAGLVLDWLATARHPRFDRPYTDLTYQPMLELMAWLRSEGFKTYIVSGGGIDFMRPWTERAYGIPPEQVVGSSGVTRYEIGADGIPSLVKEGSVAFVDDGPGKPVGIDRFIGRRPILAFGNSDGDQQMLEWTAAGDGLRFAALVHHDDAEREWAYDRESSIGRLDKALDEARARGWIVVSMKRDWAVVFPWQRE